MKRYTANLSVRRELRKKFVKVSDPPGIIDNIRVARSGQVVLPTIND